MNTKYLFSRMISDRRAAGLTFGEAKLNETFALLQTAKATGYLGSHRPKSPCLVETVNVANELLRTKFVRETIEQIAVSEGDEIYVYISLVSLKCFRDIHSLAA